MKLKKCQLILEIFSVSLFFFIIHKLIFELFKESFPENKFYYSLQQMYLFFFSCAAILILILTKVKQKNIDHVGNTFLLLTSIKMGISYAVLSPVIQSQSATIPLEKMNFFIIFAVFLATETVFTIRLLNNKQ